MEPKLLNISDFCQYVGVKKTSAYKLIGLGKVQVARIGRRTLVTRASADQLIENSMSSMRDA